MFKRILPSSSTSSSQLLLSQLLKKLAKITQPHLTKLLLNQDDILLPKKHWTIDDSYPNKVKPLPFHNNNNSMNNNNIINFTTRDLYSKPFKILSLDGGGTRGIITNTILQRINKHNPLFMKSIDLICGTSVGGILSLLHASGYNTDEVQDILKFAIPHIFQYNPWRQINPFKSRYSDKSKQEIFEYYFNKRKMMDLQKLVAIISFRLDGKKSKTHSFFNKEGWRPAIFSNMPKASGLVEPDIDLFVWDAAMRTSAAPTYFPVFKGYTDGAIVANNPSIIGVSKAIAHYPNVNMKNIAVLSIGAGSYPRHTNVFSSANNNDLSISTTHNLGLQVNHADWGIKQWIPFLLDLLLDGDSVTTEMVMNYLLTNNGLYHRIDPLLPRQIAIDDVKSVDEMISFANNIDLTETFKFIDNKFMDHNFDSTSDFNNSLDHATNYHEAWENSGITYRK
jgi:hypothetical protein